MPHQLGIASLDPDVVFGIALGLPRFTVVLSTIIPVVSRFFLISCSATAPCTADPPPLTIISSPNVVLKISTRCSQPVLFPSACGLFASILPSTVFAFSTALVNCEGTPAALRCIISLRATCLVATVVELFA